MFSSPETHQRVFINEEDLVCRSLQDSLRGCSDNPAALGLWTVPGLNQEDFVGQAKGKAVKASEGIAYQVTALLPTIRYSGRKSLPRAVTPDFEAAR